MLLKHIRPEYFGPFTSTRPLEVEPDVTVLTGPNDAGKSMALRAIALSCGSNETASEEEVNRDRFGEHPGRWQDDPKIGCDLCFEVKSSHARPPSHPTKPDPGDLLYFRVRLSTWGRTINEVKRGGSSLNVKQYRAPQWPTVVTLPDESEIRNVIDLNDMTRAEGQLLRLGLGSQFTAELHKSMSKTNRSMRVGEAEERLNEHLKAVLPPTLPLRFRLFEVAGNPETLAITLVDQHRGHTPLGSRGTGVRRFLSVMSALLSLNVDSGHTILLYDEPETSLHADAQHMLRRLLEGLGGHENLQVIYTTHSPSMINTLRPRSLRVLARQRVDDRATTVFVNRAYHGNYSHVRASLGITPGDSLLYAPITLVIEGATETLCLSLILEKLDEAGVFGDTDLKSLLAQSHILDGGGSKFSVMIPLVKSQHAHPVVFLDGDKRAEGVAVQADHGDVPVILLPPGKEFEDLIPAEAYVRAAVAVCELSEAEADYGGFCSWEANEIAANRIRPVHMFSKRVERWLDDKHDKVLHKPSAMRKALEEINATDITVEPFKQLVEAMKLVAAQM